MSVSMQMQAAGSSRLLEGYSGQQREVVDRQQVCVTCEYMYVCGINNMTVAYDSVGV
jgi:hypothetical protein